MLSPHEAFLSGVDRLSRRLGPLNRTITTLADYLAPTATAQAACAVPGYVYCGAAYDVCWDDYYCQTHGPAPARRIRYYARHLRDCGLNPVTCNDGCKCLI